jgi:hypothetical protein
MPLPRKKDDGSTGAPVLDILRAHVRLTDVEEYTEPFTVTRKSDSAQFTLDPQFKCTVEIIDDGEDGSDNGAAFFEAFKYKNTEKDKTGEWENKENSKLGMLTKVVKPNYFEDDSIPELTEDDLEDLEFICQVKPKKNPDSGKVLGSMIDWESMKPLPNKPVATTSPVGPDRDASEDDAGEEEDWENIPF